MIELRDISKRFGSKSVLKQIDLTFESNLTHVLLGSSGCGKSTLLRIIMGLTWSDSGDVLIHGTRLTPQNRDGLARAIGYVIQDGGLFPHYTAEENASLPAKVLGKKGGWDQSRIQKRLTELSALMDLEPSILKSYPSQLSGGQRQRVGLMRALMLDPPLLLLDEPLSALDPVVRSTLRAQLKTIFNALKKTVVLVTHDLDEAAFLGDTVTLMRDGKIEQSGTLSDLALNPASPFVTEFINAQKPTQWLREIA